MRIIVTGSRHLFPLEDARQILDRAVLDAWPDEITLIHGCCPSNQQRNVDFAFDFAARELGLAVEQFCPEQYGPWPRCGPIRNSAMVSAGADIGIAYHDNLAGSSGSLDCVKKMLRAAIPVVLYDGKNPARRILRLDGDQPIMANAP